MRKLNFSKNRRLVYQFSISLKNSYNTTKIGYIFNISILQNNTQTSNSLRDLIKNLILT